MSLPRPWGTLVIVLLLVAGAGWATYRRTYTCTVGVSGTDATLTVRGWRASDLCGRLAEKSPGAYYRRDASPTGNVLCEYDDEGRHYVVRDQGALMLIGRGICAQLANDPASLRRSVGM
jgi:hypothetical protein